MLTPICILAIAALITSIISLMGKCPPGVPLILLSITELLRCLGR